MKAAVLEALEKILVKEIPTPEARAGTVLMRVHVCGVCGSDLRIFHHGNPRVKPPCVIGHEAAGEVVAVGEGVERFSVGDRIAVGADVPCGKCEFCRKGMGNCCPINYAIGYQFAGAFAEYMLLEPLVVEIGPVTKIPDGVSDEAAAIAEPLACVLNGLELARMSPGKSICIIGGGPAGLLTVEASRAMGASRIILAGRNEKRLAMSGDFGADVLVNTRREDLIERVMEETGGEGPDIVMTTCSSVEAHEQAVQMVRKRGFVNLFGGLAKGTRDMSVQSNLIHYKECFVMGSHGCVPRHHRQAMALIAAGRVKAEAYVTDRYPLEEIVAAFRAAEEKEGLKVVVESG